MQQTTNLGLNKPDYNDVADVGIINGNMDIIDEKITELQSGSGVKIYTVAELMEPAEGKIYNVKITQNTSVINGKSVYKENTTQSVTLKAGKVATVYFSGGNFFYKASASGNAVAENVLAGKKFSNENDTDIVGTMVNRGATIITPSTSNKYIASGYHNGSGYVVGDSDLVASNIVQGKNIFGVSGQALQYQQYEKTAIANALTSKGVPTSTTASWGTIEQNIRSIQRGWDPREFRTSSISNARVSWDYEYSGGYSYVIRKTISLSENGYFGLYYTSNETSVTYSPTSDIIVVFNTNDYSYSLNIEYDNIRLTYFAVALKACTINLVVRGSSNYNSLGVIWL